jgi:uncharacterized protein
MKTLNMLAVWLVVIGGVNWGTVGLLNLNIVNMLLGSMPTIEQLVYILVGISTVYLVVTKRLDLV